MRMFTHYVGKIPFWLPKIHHLLRIGTVAERGERYIIPMIARPSSLPLTISTIDLLLFYSVCVCFTVLPIYYIYVVSNAALEVVGWNTSFSNNS